MQFFTKINVKSSPMKGEINLNNLQHYRERRGLTQAELAGRAGVDRALISKAERGVLDLKGRCWLSIADALGCTVDELLGRKGGASNGDIKNS